MEGPLGSLGPQCLSSREHVHQLELKKKKNTYALKTPHVVALPFMYMMYGVEYIL